MSLRFHLNSMPQTNIPPTERVVDIANHVLSSTSSVLKTTTCSRSSALPWGHPRLHQQPTSSWAGWRLSSWPAARSPSARTHGNVSLMTSSSCGQGLQRIWMCSSNTSALFTHHQVHHRLLHRSILDILSSLKVGFLKTDIHTKTTDFHAYLPNSSCHPRHVVNNIPYSQFLSLRRLCADTEVSNARCDEMEGGSCVGAIT